mgnify:CR=1 FL=1
MTNKLYDVVALGEVLIDFTQNGKSAQGNGLFEANPGGAPGNVLAMLNNLGKKTSFIGKVGNDQFGLMLKATLEELGIGTENLMLDDEVHTTLALVHTFEDGDRDFSFYRNPGADMMLKKEDLHEFYKQCRELEQENKDVLVGFQEDYPGVLNGDNLADILKAAKAKKKVNISRTIKPPTALI